VESIKEEADMTVDKALISPVFSTLRLSSQDSSGTPYQLRMVANFGASLDRILTLPGKRFVIFIDPSCVRFATNPPDVCNFAEMQLDRDFPNRNPDRTTKTAAPAPMPVPGFAPVGGITPLVGTIHAGTTTVFKMNALPPDAVKRFSDHADLDKILSNFDIKQFSKVSSLLRIQPMP